MKENHENPVISPSGENQRIPVKMVFHMTGKPRNVSSPEKIPKFFIPPNQK